MTLPVASITSIQSGNSLGDLRKSNNNFGRRQYGDADLKARRGKTKATPKYDDHQSSMLIAQ